MADFDEDSVPDYPGLLRLDGKAFVVFGAGQGIGRQVAHALAQAGARVACVGRSEAPTRHVAEEVGGIAILGDATVRTDMARIFAEAEAELGAVHGVVDILGMVRQKRLADFTDEDWDWQFDVALRHAFLALQIGGAAIARAGGGSISFVGSVAGKVWQAYHTPYGAAKAALHHLVSNAAVELAGQGVRVNAVSPSVVATPRVRSYLDQGRGEGVEQAHPLGYLCRPSDVAGALLFMASDLARYVTGQTLYVDGGHTALSSMMPQTFFPDYPRVEKRARPDGD